MKTYCNSQAGTQIEPRLWNARESVWVISPWLGRDYAKRLALMSQKGIEIRVITSYDDFNIDSLEILKSCENPNLRFLVLDKEKAGFIHAKIYVIDNNYGVSGSANLTYSGLNSSVENLSIAETNEEVQQIRNDFINIWMKFDNKGMSNKELSSEDAHSIKNALSLNYSFADNEQPHIGSKVLVYHPYYFYEYNFRASAGKSPPVLFENRGLVVLDGVNRQIVHDALLVEEINCYPIENYVLKTENKYPLKIHQPIIRSFQEANELIINHIIEKNTQHYTQYYGNRTYDKIFIPFRNIIRPIKNGFVQVPIWYVDMNEPDGKKQKLFFGSSGKVWSEFLYCPTCQKKIWANEAIICERCGKKVCHDCIKIKGLFFTKKLCGQCLSTA